MLEGIENYRGREQSWVKHYVLSKYLQQFAQIIGFKWPSITYVDGFCGPWNSQAVDLSDTSFSSAIKELQKSTGDSPELENKVCILRAKA
jgi:three-Cys-motif partner protein